MPIMDLLSALERQSVGILLGSPRYNAPPKFKYRTCMIVLSHVTPAICSVLLFLFIAYSILLKFRV